MAHSDRVNTPNPIATLPAARAVRSDGWTPEKQVEFIRTLAVTQNVRSAAQHVGMSRQSAYKLRARLDDGPFGAAWRMAMRSGRDILLEAALDRAVHGVEVPHYWKGELIGTSRRYDERLSTFLLKSRALGAESRKRNYAEEQFAGHDLTRLLDRIEAGPAQWCAAQSESEFAWGESDTVWNREDLEDEGKDYADEEDEYGDEGADRWADNGSEESNTPSKQGDVSP